MSPMSPMQMKPKDRSVNIGDDLKLGRRVEASLGGPIDILRHIHRENPYKFFHEKFDPEYFTPIRVRNFHVPKQVYLAFPARFEVGRR
jgi:hypothetical protein